MLKYLRYSNIKLAIDLNPFTWSFRYNNQLIKSMRMIYWRVLPFTIILIIDNGTNPIQWDTL